MAFVLSSISGNLISAASAGYAPTNSADVSAIASAYQVVSSTATQLYAGTAYVTSINDAPISAARAGNAANASMATSAYYDGTGRLISALPDSAAVSSIASSYAESAASGKQDTLSFAYNTADQISSINGSALGGMDEAAVSGIASAYAESAVSSKADSSALSSYVPYSGLEYYDTAISGIDGSSLYDYSAHARITTVAGRVTSLSAEMSSKADESALSGYYTTANESGFLTAQAQASWSESASASPSYIQDKPDLVDIVAGPGIVVDNPDGNTLRVSVDQAIETVLWENSSGEVIGANQYITLSESLKNFERVVIYYALQPSWGGKLTYELVGVGGNVPFCLNQFWYREQSGYHNYWQTITFNKYDDTTLRITNIGGEQGPIHSTTWTVTSGLVVNMYKVVGIHRIANN